MKKTGLIPVCVTAMDPKTTILVQLIAMGVRMIYHPPAWLEDVEKKWGRRARVSLNWMHWCQFGCMFDIPILDLMDDFVLYTDIDELLQLFIGDLFGKICWERSTTGATGAAPAPHVREGVPKYVAVADGEFGCSV